ncbi:MAG: hypothetical protein JJ992_07435 [Planctomycetes bacterium]|nr:hypothetical protein [Planctomycetota bacterium]
MSLSDVPLTYSMTELPGEVAALLREADRQIGRFVADIPSILRGFVPSDYEILYHAVQAIRDGHLACGNSFCEWGSGLGVVASLAAMLGFDAYGIEIDRDLFEASQQLAGDFGLRVHFAHGSFIPQGADRLIDLAFADQDGGLSLDTQADETYDDLGLEIRDFDLIFVFPWPNDEPLIQVLFERFAARGALLLTYNDAGFVRLRRK